MKLFHRPGVGSVGVGVALLAAFAVAERREAQSLASPTERDGRQAIAPALPSNPLVRFYFDEPVELRLDPDRIAVWAPGGVGPVLPAVFAPDSAEPLGVPGWHLLRLGSPVTAEDLPALLEDLPAALGSDYVSPVFVDDLGGPLVPTRDVLMQFAPEVEPAQAEAVLVASGVGEILDRDWAGLPRAYRLRSAASNGLDALAAANALAKRSDVRFAEPDFVFTGVDDSAAGVEPTGLAESTGGVDPFAPNDPSMARSWSLNSPGFFDHCIDMDWDMEALEAWKITRGDPSVRVLIMSNGVDPSHPDLNQDPGRDFTGQGGGGAPVEACDRLGTTVAGCVSMIADNGLGSTGVAPGCKIVSARVYTANCSSVVSMSSWNVLALEWAVNNNIWITISTGTYFFEPSALTAQYQQTRDLGAIHFAGAGIAAGTSTQIYFPANLPTVNTVSHFVYWGNVGPTRYGPEMDFAAPGWNIFTTDRTGAAGYSTGNYVTRGGTATAGAYVAGVAALLRSEDPTLSPDSIERRLRLSAFDLESPGWNQKSGWGLVRAGRALQLSKRRRVEPASSPTPSGPGIVAIGSAPPSETRRTSERPSFSDDGRYAAFRSFSGELVAGDTNDESDVFVRDLQTATLERVSVDSNGAQGYGESGWPSISADGRYVAFESWSTNLVPGDTNGEWDVFLHDRQTGTTNRVSVGTGGVESDGRSLFPNISADGRYVAFNSNALNLDPAANGNWQIYVHDTQSATTTLVTKNSSGEAADTDCWIPWISDGGTRVAFGSAASNLVAGANGMWHAFVCDMGTSTFFLASVDTAGTQRTANSFGQTISGDGNRVSFWTTGALDPADTNGLYDVYVRDLAAGTTMAASKDASGNFGTRDAFGLQLSQDGRYVVLLSANPFVPGDTNNQVDAFRKDLQTGEVLRVSLGPNGRQARGGSSHPWISPDGGMVGFVSSDDRLTPGDEPDSYADVYLHTVATGQTILVSGGS